MDQLARVLQTENFQQTAMLLILGAALTGILVPLIKARLDHSSFQRRKVFEAQLGRQSEVIKAQTDFLKEFSRHIWDFHRICQRVSFSRLHGDKQDFEQAVKNYREGIWDVLHGIRSAIGAARWFTSDSEHAALCAWYEEWFIGLSSRITGLLANESSYAEWSAHHLRVHKEAPARNYGIIKQLASDFGITSIVEGDSSRHASGTA